MQENRNRNVLVKKILALVGVVIGVLDLVTVAVGKPTIPMQRSFQAST